MAGELIRDYGSWITLEANGASIANNAFGEANDDTFEMPADGGGRLHLELEMVLTFGTAPTANTSVAIYARDLNVVNASDHAGAPSANNRRRAVASVSVENVTSAQRFRFDILNAPRDASYWLENAGTNQTISAGWTLRARAWSPKAAT